MSLGRLERNRLNAGFALFASPHLASGGGSGLAIWDHIAAASYVATDVSNGAFQFTSGLRAVMATRMVPKADSTGW